MDQSSSAYKIYSTRREVVEQVPIQMPPNRAFPRRADVTWVFRRLCPQLGSTMITILRLKHRDLLETFSLRSLHLLIRSRFKLCIFKALINKCG
jgi:hypothetical protein